jgi:hypothetical protein
MTKTKKTHPSLRMTTGGPESDEQPSSSYELARTYTNSAMQLADAGYHDDAELLSDTRGLLSGNPVLESRHHRRTAIAGTRRASYIRALALLCAMSLSIGSH